MFKTIQMKKNIFLIASLSLVMFMLWTSSCKKNFSKDAQYTLLDSSMAYLKVVHAVYVNTTKLTGTPLSFNSLFPLGYSAISGGTSYAAVQPGAQQIRLSIPGISTVDSATILSLNKNFVAGRFYTLMITDSIKSTSDSNKIFVQDMLPVNASVGYINFRFANVVTNDSATIGSASNINLFDVYSYARNTVVLTKIRMDSITGFQVLATNITTPDTFYITRNPKATGTVLLANRVVLAKVAFIPNTSSPQPTSGSTYTFYYKGDGVLTSGTRARTLTYYVNR